MPKRGNWNFQDNGPIKVGPDLFKGLDFSVDISSRICYFSEKSAASLPLPS